MKLGRIRIARLCWRTCVTRGSFGVPKVHTDPSFSISYSRCELIAPAPMSCLSACDEAQLHDDHGLQPWKPSQANTFLVVGVLSQQEKRQEHVTTGSEFENGFMHVRLSIV